MLVLFILVLQGSSRAAMKQSAVFIALLLTSSSEDLRSITSSAETCIKKKRRHAEFMIDLQFYLKASSHFMMNVRTFQIISKVASKEECSSD